MPASVPPGTGPTPAPRIRRRHLIAGTAGLAVLGGAGLIARNQLSHPDTDKASRPDGRFRSLVLACPHPAHDPVLILAQRQGIFARYNLEVSCPDGYASGQEALDQLHPGGADAAVVPALSWLPRLMAGLDARLVTGLQSGSARLLVPRGSPIKRIEDLHRRAIGIADASIGAHASADRLFFSIMMRRKGMNPNNDVTWVETAPDRFGAALSAGTVAAVVGHDPVIWQVREALHLTELASSMTGSYGTRVSRVLGLRGDLLRADPAAAVSLSLAVQEAARTVAAHLDAAASMLDDQLPDMDLASIERMLRAEGHAVHPVGAELRDQIAQYIDELQLIGLADGDPDSAQLADRFCAGVIHA